MSYKAAAARARAPLPFRPYLRRHSVEGFLFPALYEFTQETRASELVAMQIATFERRWRTIDLDRARARGRTAYDVLIIASMIERETVVPAERRLVSAVIYNRLEKDMRSRSTRRFATASASPATGRSRRGSCGATRRTTPAASGDYRRRRSGTPAFPP